MDFFNGFIKTYWYYLVIGVLSLLLIGSTLYIFNSKNAEVQTECDAVAFVENEEVPNKIFVDVKGAVKSPGVYEMSEDSIINDVIKTAGGFTKKAYTTNINLSKKITNEMVIYVFTKTEYKNLNKEEVTTTTCQTSSYNIDSCTGNGNSVISSSENVGTTEEVVIESNTTTKEETNDKISINTATKEELMKLDGIGESKADNIIKYREENGGFKTIEDIKNVSGIGDAAYEKIKDSITI